MLLLSCHWEVCYVFTEERKGGPVSSLKGWPGRQEAQHRLPSVYISGTPRSHLGLSSAGGLCAGGAKQGQAQRPAGRWHWLCQHFSTPLLQHQVCRSEPPVAEVGSLDFALEQSGGEGLCSWLGDGSRFHHSRGRSTGRWLEPEAQAQVARGWAGAGAALWLRDTVRGGTDLALLNHTATYKLPTGGSPWPTLTPELCLGMLWGAFGGLGKKCPELCWGLEVGMAEFLCLCPGSGFDFLL